MENEIKIPKSFDLMGHTYKVRQVKKVDKEDSCGEYISEKKVLRLKKVQKDYPQSMLEETYFHELLHAVLEECEYTKLSADEKFVERVGRALHQVIKTAKYNEL